MWDEWSLGVRTWGHNLAGDCLLLVGTYGGEGEVSRPLLTVLPPVVLLNCEEAGTSLIRVLADEGQVEAPGQRALLDRLLDVLLISTLRTWFLGRRHDAPGWFRAQQDPAVGQALSLLHRARIARAQALLETTNLAVDRISDLVGFARPHHLPRTVPGDGRHQPDRLSQSLSLDASRWLLRARRGVLEGGVGDAEGGDEGADHQDARRDP